MSMEHQRQQRIDLEDMAIHCHEDFVFEVWVTDNGMVVVDKYKLVPDQDKGIELVSSATVYDLWKKAE